ncbi:hypothetical protein [Paenibacillus xylanexedens]|uniref:hypothetical protein n=1 Tax=Paenibacillus xylanexedens TaxID=528191 RepID=UPI003CFD20B4
MKTIESFFEPFPVLETERTLLRPLTYDDLEDMSSYCVYLLYRSSRPGTRIRAKKTPKLF